MSHRVLKNTNLKASEIRDALATGGGIVSNDTLSFFKADAKINIWSKFKPLDTKDISGTAKPDFVQAFDENREYYNPTWWKGFYGDCGIVVPHTVREGINVFLDNVRNGNYYWTYRLPNSPFRLTDFCSYDIDAECPINGTLADHYWLQPHDDTYRLTFTFDHTTDLPYTNLTLDDIQVTAANIENGTVLTTLSNYYLGIIFWREVGGKVTRMFYPTSTTKLGTNGVSIELEGLSGDAYWGEFYAMPYLSSSIQGLDKDEQEATYATFNIAPKKVYIHGPGELYIAILNASFKNDKEVQYELYIQNFDSGTLKNPTIYASLVRTPRDEKHLNGNEGETESSIEYTIEGKIGEIPANTTVSFYSTNYDPGEGGEINEEYKILPPLWTIDARDEDKYQYWVGGQVNGYAKTWWNLDDAAAPEEQQLN